MATNRPVAECIFLKSNISSLSNVSLERHVREAVCTETGSIPMMPVSVLAKLGDCDLSMGFFACLVQSFGRNKIAEIKITQGACYGIAVDLGSTTVVLYLVDLSKAFVVDTLAFLNPQRDFGEDILSRIIFSHRHNGLETLKSRILSAINDAISAITQKNGVSAQDVFFVSVAGNTTMCHLFLGLDPSGICREPYRPVANSFDIMTSLEAGLDVHKEAGVYIFPNIGSYFGGDLIAGIVASGMHERDEISILVDVGTNAEVVLGNKDWLVASAGAAGPALEGGILACGMSARQGAIEKVWLEHDEIRYLTIGGKKPLGICGSGVIDLIATMFSAGLLDKTGKLQPDCRTFSHKFRKLSDGWAFIVALEDETETAMPVYITQNDIKSFIRSKAAMYAILEVITESVGIDFDDIERFYVAGAFGSHINPVSAMTIGMLPELGIERFNVIGNSAGSGAVKLLVDASIMDQAEAIRDRITYLEMNARGDFMDKLTAAMFLPHTDGNRFR